MNKKIVGTIVTQTYFSFFILNRITVPSINAIARGAMFYDLASLLWDPYVELSLTEIKDFFEYWRVSYRETKTYTKDDAWEAFIHASLQRVMQA